MKIREITESTSPSLTDIIVKVRNQYNADGIPTIDIANGECENFARDVLDIWQGDDWIHREGQGNWRTVETGNFITYGGEWDDIPEDWDWELLKKHWNITPPTGFSLDDLKQLAIENPNHVWITYNGKHYDAESPEGVSSFFDLMFFKRWLSTI